jgi:hypothetical protein
MKFKEIKLEICDLLDFKMNEIIRKNSDIAL